MNSMGLGILKGFQISMLVLAWGLLFAFVLMPCVSYLNKYMAKPVAISVLV